MAAVMEMGEVDEMHSKEDDITVNGDMDCDKDMEDAANEDGSVDSEDDDHSQGPNENSDCDTSEGTPKMDITSIENGNETASEPKDSEDIVIVDAKENGEVEDVSQVINLESPVKKKKKSVSLVQSPPRRSSRNLNKQRSYVESDKEEVETMQSEESDIEEVLPQDPLAMGEPAAPKKVSNPAIVVKDTKSLVEIASKTSPSVGGKKEPTLVIIDTNSILSGRGPVPLVPNKSKNLTSKTVFSTKPGIISKSKPLMLSNKSTLKTVNKTSMSSFSMLPMALPAQGVYPANMRATITPIPMTTSQKSVQPQAPVLSTLTDDMFVVEAPSFIVPYVYEKPPLKDFKDFVKDIKIQVMSKKDDDDSESDEKLDDSLEKDEKSDTKELGELDEGETTENKKSYSYFDSPLGKFFVDIGTSLVQEFVQTDLLRQQKRKREREGGQNSTTNKTIQSLIKNLEYSKENNVPYKMDSKKCEYCSFKTESALAMSFHLETPHMKNYIYRCNFCPYEVRNPHDILFHMEAEHAVRGHLERAPAFHQCPNCPFEDNQKGKLTRHLVACTRKFKPERNLEPPIDWEPPAKIPRVPRLKQPSLTSAGVYQALAKNQQYQMFSKIQQASTLMQRGRGRPSLGSPVITKPQQPLIRTSSGMVYKQTMSGGSVLVPTSYQLTGNQLYQVMGGQELGGRIGPVGPMAFVPNMSSSTVTIQQQQTGGAKKPVHQPSISITPLPRGAASPAAAANTKPGDSNSKNSFVICEICDGYIKDLEQLRNHMQWIHKVKIHPKMIYNRPPLNCQKCQFRFFTDQGLERHLLGSHGLVTSSMQEAANKSKDAGRCPVCGRVYQWKLLNHVARDHNMTLKPAHLSYKCTVCTATFGMYKQFENHVYSAHSVVAKRVMDKKSSTKNQNDTLLKPLKINDEITIIPQPAKTGGAGTSKEGSPSTNSRNSNGNSVTVSSNKSK